MFRPEFLKLLSLISNYLHSLQIYQYTHIKLFTHYISHSSASRKRSNSRSSTRKSLYLWEFLFGLLEDEECTSVITWTDKREGIFELKNTEELAKLWGTVKNRPRMDKSKLIRAIRTYYERGMLKKVKVCNF
jgi:hypothetical protein